MHIDFLVVGQGICGTWLSYYLNKAGYSCIVMDDPDIEPLRASTAAAGIINPVTGRRMVKTWLIDDVLPFAMNAYASMEKDLGFIYPAIEQKDVIDFFPTPQMKEAFAKRMQEDDTYISMPSPDQWTPYFNFEFGCGKIAPCYAVNLLTVLPGYAQYLMREDRLLDEKLSIEDLVVTNGGIRYKDITANYIIFCDGIRAMQNPYFRNLPFAPNKGEVMFIGSKHIPVNNIYKKGINLVQLESDLFWVGSSYEWQFEHDQPTELFRERTIAALKSWLRVPFTIGGQWASIRPATIERRPFIGFHPLYPAVGIFNGMGTKGCSLAPYFAHQFVENIKHQTPIHPEASINRFKRILSL